MNEWMNEKLLNIKYCGSLQTEILAGPGRIGNNYFKSGQEWE